MQNFASTDTLRSSLNGIYCERMEYKTLVTATDGTKLLTYSFTHEFFKSIFKDEFGIEPTKKSFILYQDKKTRKALNVSLMDTKEIYPRYKNIIPQNDLISRDKVDFPIFFNPKLMAKVQSDLNSLLNTPKNILIMDYFTTSKGATVKYLDSLEEFIHGGILILMPINPSPKTNPIKPIATDFSLYE